MAHPRLISLGKYVGVGWGRLTMNLMTQTQTFVGNPFKIHFCWDIQLELSQLAEHEATKCWKFCHTLWCLCVARFCKGGT